jgi:hypothetical protein
MPRCGAPPIPAFKAVPGSDESDELRFGASSAMPRCGAPPIPVFKAVSGCDVSDELRFGASSVFMFDPELEGLTGALSLALLGSCPFSEAIFRSCADWLLFDAEEASVDELFAFAEFALLLGDDGPLFKSDGVLPELWEGAGLESE